MKERIVQTIRNVDTKQTEDTVKKENLEKLVFGDMQESRSEDDRLLLLVKQGNTEAFCEFYEKTKGQVYGYAFRMLHQEQDAQEVVQETYLKVWKEAASYEADGKPMAWVFTIARNFCYMNLRGKQRRKEQSLEEMQEQETGEEVGEFCQEIEFAPERQTIMEALLTLNKKERQIILLHVVSGMKHREIAEQLQMPISTVLSLYHRAMKKLWQRIEKNG